MHHYIVLKKLFISSSYWLGSFAFDGKINYFRHTLLYLIAPKYIVHFLIGFLFHCFSAAQEIPFEMAAPGAIPLLIPQPIIENYTLDYMQINDQSALRITATDKQGNVLREVEGTYSFFINKQTVQLDFSNGIAYHPIEEKRSLLVFIRHGSGLSGKKLFHFYIKEGKAVRTHIPLWASILPPLVTIFFALLFRQVIMALFIGIWLGAFIVHGFRLELILLSFFNVLDTYIISALLDTNRLSVIVFSMMIGGMVAVISRNGGMTGVVMKLSRYARSPRSAQLITWLLGIAIFFDDYANTLIVGNTMRPVTDRFRISREKLAYIVDSTAAPIAAIAFFTTWIGAELGYIEGATKAIGIEENAYRLFLHSLQYAYYPVLTILFMFFLILLKKDFGPMHTAELLARASSFTQQQSALQAKTATQFSEHMENLGPAVGIPHRWQNAFLPILALISVTIGGLLYTGYDTNIWMAEGGVFYKLSATIGNANAYVALLWGSLAGAGLAILLTVLQKLLHANEVSNTLMEGFKTMLPAIIILVFAWALAYITDTLYTADYLTSLLSNSIQPEWLPVITFLLAAITSFSTGTSWGTMAILYPLALPATWSICQTAGMDYNNSMNTLYPVISAILAGAVFGDHCSPISDTTILSSLASGCNHIEHVRTQLPYALVTAGVSTLLLVISPFMPLHWTLLYIIGIALVWIIAKYLGKAT